MKHLHKLLTLIFICLASTLFSQMVGTNSFLKGTYVEVGVNDCGAYGSNAMPPAGYHATSPFTGLGFVADSDMDGWTTGTPDYCGDYFVPGSPVEGWEIQVGANVWTNTDQSCWTSEIPGSITGYDYTAGVYTTTWEGNITSGSFDIDVTQRTELPEDKLYFLTFINICNNGATPLTDVYYKRNVDPDQDQPWSGDFTTFNDVVSNPPGDCQAVVTSEGLTYGCFLGMGAIDSMARASRGNFSTTDGTAAQAWAGTGGYSLTGTSTADLATQITFKIPEILPGECHEVVFAYILNIDDLNEALLATGSYEMIVDDISVDNGDTIPACTIDTVKMEIINGDGFTWEWSPSAGLDVDTGVIVYATPDVTTEYTVTGYATCDTVTFIVTIDVPLPPVANAGPDVFVCKGDTVHLNGSGGATYLWTPPVYLDSDTLEDPAVIGPLTNMFYQLVVYNVLGCSDTDDVLLTLFPDPIIDAGEDEIMMIGGFSQLLASGGVTYEWTPDTWLSNTGISDPISLAEDTIMYYVTGTDINGCKATDSMVVFVLQQTLVASPTAFTPNGDGLNDTYRPILIGLGEITSFSIFNRWGSLIYSSGDPNLGWDGTFRTNEQEIGNYVVMIHAVDGLGNEVVKSSTVLLMR
ncbi:MAG: gliding motility-associated C-terminal domain-containing protein [Chitinophagales bacterium]|jgi:gliding motility-associated-like protein|nr:gliding motility-associated C-terminal domain-containing protein [Bacteroidota bacterium]MBK7568861.1 gliding motility-associated C-terminal domain-containing protein [Bacteroidota bacterium]MBP8915406.1 gliding motility-associated C-terminal domain-containing protein [Chitinophagales bacterium]MBP9220329.1 gliding motility-associated C-terminal domain-containing protein [Chitinophagales bacterium]MBP9794611.1 gliding motility-associated C-terminal domain-containing protein [Chitinophagales 